MRRRVREIVLGTSLLGFQAWTDTLSRLFTRKESGVVLE